MKTPNAQKEFIVAVSCVGSGVGQSVINSLRLSRLPMKTVGFGTNPFAYGAYDCAIFDYTPVIYADNYISQIIEKCKEHKIDLLIPTLDDEILIIAQNITKLNAEGINVICSDKELVMICRDKERMSKELNKAVNVFVNTIDKDALLEDENSTRFHFPLIAKPCNGFASRGIVILNTKQDLLNIADNYIIQELAIPERDDPNYEFFWSEISKKRLPQVSEISVQLVYSPDGKLLGRMSSFNRLSNGIPIEVLPYDNQRVWDEIDQLQPVLLKLGLRGPFNLQGRMTETGFKIFEMNPRFTGITGMRALMGFNEVEVCVKEWLGIDKGKNSLRVNHNRFGMRQTADKSIPIERNEKVLSLYKRINNGPIGKKKSLFITGSSEALGRNLIFELIKTRLDSYDIWAFDLDKRKIERLFGGQIQCCFDQDDLKKGRVPLGNIDILLHFGNTTPFSTNTEIADDLEFSNELFTRAISNQVPTIINISSQSVYGKAVEPVWNEKTPVSPDSLYAQERYATELLLHSFRRMNNQLFSSSLRLCSIVGSDYDLLKKDIFPKIVRQAYEGKRIFINKGPRELDFIHIQDATSAFIALLDSHPGTWKPIYNLGSGKVYDLADIAEKVVEHASRHNGGKRSEIILDKENVLTKTAMDCSLFMNDIGWKPRFDIDDMIKSVVGFYETDQKVKRRPI